MNPKIVYSGDRELSVKVLKFLIDNGCKPLALLIVDEKRASHAKELINLCNYLDRSKILVGTQFRSVEGVRVITELEPDYVLGIHFPYMIPKEILSIPKHGVLNLHPAYLPFNRGWHTPTWVIWEGTPYGATLHFMDEGVDTGDIIYQKRIEVLPSDTADSVYKKALDLEYEVFVEAWPLLVSGEYHRKSQKESAGTFHKKSDITLIQHINMEDNIKAADLIKRLRALTTNDIREAAYFEDSGKIYRIQVRIVEENGDAQ